MSINKPNIIIPTDEEDAVINRAAASDPDSAPLSEKELATMQPASECLPTHLYKKMTRGKQVNPTKQKTTIRLSADVLEYFRSTGTGWQTRIDEILLDYVETLKKIDE